MSSPRPALHSAGSVGADQAYSWSPEPASVATMLEEPVDLVVNVFERTYRDVLVPGWFDEIERQNQYKFHRKVILINNVEDAEDAQARAAALVSSGELTEWHFVATELPRALELVGLRARDLEPLPHFTDCALVAISLQGSDLVVYWDADVKLLRSVNWIGPSIALMNRYSRIAVANPCWDATEAGAEAFHAVDDFVLGYGFSDWAFLFRRSVFATQDFRRIVPATWRYPLAHVVPVFEQQVDSWMRRGRWLRATYVPASTEHQGAVGTAYPSATFLQRSRRRLFDVVGPRLSRRFPKSPIFTAYGPDDRPLA